MTTSLNNLVRRYTILSLGLDIAVTGSVGFRK